MMITTIGFAPTIDPSVGSLRPRRRSRILMKIHELIALLREDGWYLARTRGSHRQFKHPTKAGVVTMAGKPSDDLAPRTLGSILKQAGMKK